jgi:peptidoglycan/LPS O-acetylase OafA/YrhL
MRCTRTIAGILWALFGVAMLLWDIVDQAPDGFPLSGAYYAVTWGVFVGCIVGGALMALERPLGRWLAFGTALAVGLNQLWVVLAYVDEAPAPWVARTAAVILLAVVVAAIACKQPNSTVERDGPQAARPSP